MKNVIKFVGALLLGVTAGFLIAGLGLVIFTDLSWREFFSNLLTADASRLLLGTLVGVAAMLLSLLLLIVLHEAGHLVAGLATGYRFVSFRVFNLTLLRDAESGRLRLKRFAVAGTGGQCLLTPPERPLAEIPVMAYNLGGIAANLLALLIVLPIMFLADLHPLMREALSIFLIVDAVLLLINGIPISSGGLSNDAGNVRLLRRDFRSRRLMVNQLKSNAMVQQGVRPKDMPDELFEIDGEPDYSNPLDIYPLLARSSCMLDRGQTEQAHELLEQMYAHSGEIMHLYLREIECELVYTSLLTGRTERARELYTAELQKYAGQYRRMMSSKERLFCAVALLMDGDREAARKIYDELARRRGEYVMQGEVASDLALMESLLKDTAVNG